jgi:UDP-2,4-diacetamido-2,4,6-trideoxy-beta-L-altropyranose hydrolase
MKVIFRVDSSYQIGSGHVMRCLVLAQSLRAAGCTVKFVCRDLSGNISSLLEDSLFETVILNSPISEPLIKDGYSSWLGVSQEIDANQMIEFLDDSIVDWVIVDHYSLDEYWERRIERHGCRILVIDDLANRRHQCDVLIDANFVKGYSQRYENLVKTSCAALLGPDYCLISHEYNNPNLSLRERSGLVGRVLLYFGGVDQFNLSGLCLDVFSIDELKHIDLDIVIGTMNQNYESLSIAGVKRGKTTLHSSIPHLAKLINSADLALGAGGVTTWERMCLGLPSMIISIAENQVLGAETLSENKFATYLGFHTEITKKSLANAITAKISNPSEILQESLAGKKLVDGKGVFRIINCMTSF